jgi:hypothetical protein
MVFNATFNNILVISGRSVFFKQYKFNANKHSKYNERESDTVINVIVLWPQALHH